MVFILHFFGRFLDIKRVSSTFLQLSLKNYGVDIVTFRMFDV